MRRINICIFWQFNSCRRNYFYFILLNCFVLFFLICKLSQRICSTLFDVFQNSFETNLYEKIFTKTFYSMSIAKNVFFALMISFVLSMKKKHVCVGPTTVNESISRLKIHRFTINYFKFSLFVNRKDLKIYVVVSGFLYFWRESNFFNEVRSESISNVTRMIR